MASGISGFYQKLYNKVETSECDADYYDNCLNLSEQSKVIMDADLTLEELLKALMSCSNSAPGSDGIPYSQGISASRSGRRW